MVASGMCTARQVAALKYLTFSNIKKGTLAKQILSILIDASEGLTKDVCLTLMEDREGYSADEIEKAVANISQVLSSAAPVRFNELLILTGSNLRFCLHYGDFNPNRAGDKFDTSGQFASMGLQRSQVSKESLLTKGMPLRYTFWLAQKYYSREAVFVAVTREVLEATNVDASREGDRMHALSKCAL